MSCSRRDLLKNSLKGAVGASVSLSAFRLISPATVKASIDDSKTRWVFLVDTNKCVGCGMCVRACKKENEVPYDTPVSRTWVERYVIMKNGKAHIDSPQAGRDGFTSPKIRDKEINPDEIAKGFFVPKLCNQCKQAACVQVCPVGATYQTPEGVVLIDRTWCIGCGYCVMACPYGMRFFHPVHKVAEKCTFCYHRISKGMKTACVQACPFGARNIGNLKNPNDPVTKTIMTERVSVLKDEYGTKLQVFYLGLDNYVR